MMTIEHVPAAASPGELVGSALHDAPVTAARATTLVVDLRGGLGFEYAAHESLEPGCTVVVSDCHRPDVACATLTLDEFVRSSSAFRMPGTSPELPDKAGCRLVLFLPDTPQSNDVAAKSRAAVIDRSVSIAARNAPCQVCVVGSIHMGDGHDESSAFEESFISRFQNVGVQTIVLRTGHLIDSSCRWPAAWSRFAAWYPLIPAAATSVFLDRDELFSAIDRVGAIPLGMRHRRLTLLGRRRPLRDVLAEFVQARATTRLATWLVSLLSWLQIGRIAGLFLIVAGRFYRPLQRWHISTLNPRSMTELLGLFHPLNQRYVALAGYNTGVTHFGWKYPGKTVIRTTGSGRLVRVRGQTVTVDAGVLLKRVIQELGVCGKELYVVPNYSYISLGTVFMVPVHGSGSDVSTLGETIEQALIYDPAVDKILRIRRGDDLFGRYMYNPSSGILVLRLRLRVRDKSRYFVKRSLLNLPSAADIWRTFCDAVASNIELRKSQAADSNVSVSKYYTAPSDDNEFLEIPRDSIGRLWDRLEENAVTSWLFHTYVRKCGFHVELFLDEREFEIFWRSHSALPLSKVQLRFVKRDRLSHSPFGDCDRISVDIFLKRKLSAPFLSFMKEHLPHARFNPGKHSM
jgi:hypothetical protein